MATTTSTVALAELPLERLSLYHAVDPYLSSILVFYGPVTTANATVSSSRIQAHIFTPAGAQSYPRITVSPAAPLYAAVNRLPREKQGDEVCRGLAVSMLKYFAELSQPVRDYLQDFARAGKPGGRIPRLFDEMHAAELANRMNKIEATPDLIRDVRDAFGERKIPWIDVDVVLPPGHITEPSASVQDDDEDLDVGETPQLEYGRYAPLIRALGEPVFLPTSRLKRAPSQSTNISKSRVFTRSQKESLRLAMCEVVDTEERYVAKLYSLVHEIADQFKARAKSRLPTSTSPDDTALDALFPPCLRQILEVNMSFLAVIRQVLEETEKDAITDIAEDTELPPSVSRRSSPKDGRDAIGAFAFANALLEWFPRFSQPYGEYMRAHTGFTQTLNRFLRDKDSSFSKRVHETGEMQLRSLLMEPVQRLPRYSLLIDTMTSSLPLIHPAVRPLLKARDVIKEICALDNASSVDHARSVQRLKELVGGWPATILPIGRLINAVDFTELLPPYRAASQAFNAGTGMLLLYKNCIVLLSKRAGSTATARALQTDLENPAATSTDASVALPPASLRVARVLDLLTVRCMQSACGRILYLVPSSKASRTCQHNASGVLALELLSAYEGRAGRLIEEMVKATIEGRFSEKERETGKWTLRTPSQTVANLGLLACVFEDDNAGMLPQPSSCSRIRVVFDTPRATSIRTLESTNVEVIVSVSEPNEDHYQLDIDSITGSSSTDLVTADSFIPVLSKRLLNLIPPLHGPGNDTLTEPFVHSNFEILRYFAGQIIAQVRVPRSFRPVSPTKLLSSFLGGQTKEPAAGAKAPTSATLFGDFPKMPPPRLNISRANTMPSTLPGPEVPEKRGPVENGTATQEKSKTEAEILEQVLSAYVLALRSRSGNIVGRTLRARGNADRSSVNELYNVLLEDPGKLQAAAEVPVDVLFVAFETFMANAWKEKMGPIIEPSTLSVIQSQFDKMIPRDFDEQFQKCIAEISPPNRRAFAALVRLLAELLDASGNDGDRGALTVAFAQVLTESRDPMQHVSLLDRLVDDFDNLFDGVDPGGPAPFSTPSKATSSYKSGSVNSNTSSFRKRFGFSLHREASKSDAGESKVSSILRTLSKSRGPGDSEPSTPGTPRSLLVRSKSIDVDTRHPLLLRPPSRDRTNVFSISEEVIRRPGSSHEEVESFSSLRLTENGGVVRVRRRRRSSLSDFRLPTASTEASATSPAQPLRPSTPASGVNRPRPEVVTPTMQARPHTSHGSANRARTNSQARTGPPVHLGSPMRRMSPPRQSTPSRKENIDPRLTLTEWPGNQKTGGSLDSPTADHKGRSRGSSIPTRAGGLREVPALLNGLDSKRPLSFSSSQKTPKLRMQSPQKLRERLQSEKNAQMLGHLEIQDEFNDITRAMQSLTTVARDDGILLAADSRKEESASTVASGAEIMTRVQALQMKVEALILEYNGRTSAIERDLESSLVVSEKRVKKLDELYREASAENEALYDRFNSELSKIARDVRAGSGEAALKAQLATAMEEIGRLKKENLRLKREIGGLRAQQAAVALLKASE